MPPTPAPSRKPTARPIAPGSYCNACIDQTQYSQCGDRGLNGFSFCSFDYLGNWICLQNGYCVDHTQVCSSHADCPSYQACAIAGCSSLYLCYDRCVCLTTVQLANLMCVRITLIRCPRQNRLPNPLRHPLQSLLSNLLSYLLSYLLPNLHFSRPRMKTHVNRA